MDAWCRAHAQARGAVLPLEQLWQLARVWYGDRLDPDWQRPTVDRLQQHLDSVGLTAPFWRLVPAV